MVAEILNVKVREISNSGNNFLFISFIFSKSSCQYGGLLGESWGMANTFLLGLVNATYMYDWKSLVYKHKEQVKYY